MTKAELKQSSTLGGDSKEAPGARQSNKKGGGENIYRAISRKCIVNYYPQRLYVII